MARTMTSATRRGRSLKPRNDRAGLGVVFRGGPAGNGRGAGFTIIEIVLAIGLLVLLAAVMVTGFGRWYDTERIDEGARRVEAVLRMARAEASSSGRRIRLSRHCHPHPPSRPSQPSRRCCFRHPHSP